MVQESVKTVAVCIYGITEDFDQSKIDSISAAVSDLYGNRYELTFFENHSGKNCFSSLYLCCWSKTCREVELQKQFDRCIAISITTPLLSYLSTEIQSDNSLYFFRGGLMRRVGTLISPEMFHAPSTTFNRACEFIKWDFSCIKPMLPEYENTGYRLQSNFYCYLKSWNISTKCPTVTDNSLFKHL